MLISILAARSGVSNDELYFKTTENSDSRQVERLLGRTKIAFLVSADKIKCILCCAGAVIGGCYLLGNKFIQNSAKFIYEKCYHYMEWLVIGIVINTKNEVIGILSGKSDPKYY